MTTSDKNAYFALRRAERAKARRELEARRDEVRARARGQRFLPFEARRA